MKFIILVALIALAAAVPAPQKETQVLQDNRDVRADGYNFDFALDDGTKRSEEGKPTVEGALAQSGRIEFKLADGQTFVLTFVADENGYRPESSFLPVHHQ